MFRFASYLLPAQAEISGVRVVQLSESQLQKPQGIKDFRFLLRKLDKSKAAEIVWLTDDFPQMDYVQQEPPEKKKNKKQKEKNKDKKVEETVHWKPTEGERNKLAWMLENQNVFLTQYKNTAQHQNNIPYNEVLIYQDGWRKYIPALFLSQKKTFRLTKTELPYRVYPFDYQESGEKSLIWYDHDGSFTLPDLSLALFSQYQNNKKLFWNESGLIKLDTLKIKTGLSGKVFNYFSDLTNRHTRINSLSLEMAEKKSKSYFKNKIVLIGQDEHQLQVLADSLSSIDAGAVYHTPAYSWWLLPVIMCVLGIYLLWVLPLLSKTSGLFLGAFIILGIISVQPVLLILNGVWWPTINLLLFMFIGQISVYVYLSGYDILKDLSQKQTDAWFQLGHYQYQKGDYETAITSLLKCQANEEVLSDLYEIGLSFERKRQYDRALQIYSEINIRQKKYKDIDKRLKSLSGFSETRTEILSPAQAQKTLVMPDMEMPEFGRYKIEKELGRGAMGVVYLGRDPKINRKVAIKTLDYTQFNKTELKTVKSRFFREAEAAGRLSHNNIVTVYDVGEEDGFAFIAMDYVEGVPLSDFTQKNKLLPVREVYRILQVVADALGYAHSQNIVHRDIKPGNIMYNPEDRQIKITDFGIARITDSVKTRTGSFMGSPSYMAPEQMTGSRVDGQADLYSLGVSMYQLLTGNLPFDADSLGNLAYKITNEKHKSIREIRPELPASATRITNKALQKKSEKRYANGAEMADALNRGMPSE
ncbi:MAG: hypothetical protein DIZ80_03775 [endosymbiont of Galathealinum brachiosum]|uniref:non-specific serine/threonine protein kinase n=1 Tax=endosymbiont of Galathealinum brachiosum TaxID=2200906 RepID=A0A370DJW9_9GAMM|nr:MAG: hypothetical protein DIZ80_03775 [endosymbiont of Galathealinum brachiosum]